MIKVIQGINLESEYSIISIKLESNKEIIKLIEKIKSFHPIFLKEYKFSNGNLVVKSKLPYLWKNIGRELQRDTTTESKEKNIVETIIKESVSSMSTIPLLYAAHELKYETTPTMAEDTLLEYTKSFNRHYTVGCGKGSGIIYSISSSQDSKIAKEIQRDKWSSNLIMERLGIPLPKWSVIDSESDIESIWKGYQKPVVIKPTGLTGGAGVTVGIKTLEEAKKAFRFAENVVNSKTRKDWQAKIMIQEKIEGEDYRLLVIDNHLEIATKRIPAFITGDGKKTIKELINETNNDSRRDITNPSHTLKPIIIDEPLLEYLKEQKLKLDSVPKKDQIIPVRKVASMSQGGITEDVTDKVGPEIKFIVESIAASIHAFALGVDVMCKDISKPLSKDNGSILEINTMPEAYLNFYPVIGEQRGYVAETYIKKLLRDNKTKKIVVVGYSQNDIPTTLREKHIIKKDDCVGEYINSEIRINSLQINEHILKEDAIQALKINASLDTIVINHRTWDEVKEEGFGFDKIDILMIRKDMAKDFKLMLYLRRLQLKGLISKIKTF
jgi:cyanophycin synthetase